MGDVSYLAIAPEAVLALGAVVVLLVEVFFKPALRVRAAEVVFVVAGAGLATWAQWRELSTSGSSAAFSGMIALDAFSVTGAFIIVGVTALGLIAAWELVRDLGSRGAEALALILLAAAGFQFMAASRHLIMLFLAVELASISLYVLAGFTRDKPGADEAALKYFLLGGFASALFVYGSALVYAGTGSLILGESRTLLTNSVVLRPAVVGAGLALLIAGMAFKVSAAPFHAWAPDVYEGAPAGFVGFMAAAAKVGGFAALMRILAEAFPTLISTWGPALAVLAAISVLAGTLFAIAQTEVRRMLAYSGVAHAGFLLAGLLGGGAGAPRVWFYLATYSVQLVTAFAVVAVVERRNGRSTLESLGGLAKRSPMLAGALATMLVAMSGIPVTAGFVGKFGVLANAWASGYRWLVILGLIASVAAFFFYLRVISVMYLEDSEDGSPISMPRTLRWTLVAAIGFTIWAGIAPRVLLEFFGNSILF